MEVGSREWEMAGGPALSLTQRVSLLAGMGAVLLEDSTERLAAQSRAFRTPRKVELGRWSPPQTVAALAARRFLQDNASPEFVNHSLRCYWFTAIVCELAGARKQVDLEALYVAILMHDVGLFLTPPATDHCFSVTGAREARRIAAKSGWTDDRIDRMAAAITSNLNPSVPAKRFGPEAHYFRRGGIIDVLAQGWKVHPDNLESILRQHPRDGFAEDTDRAIKAEVERNPGCRFAVFGPVFPAMVRRMRFS
ncbi:HD domain-containing protein [Smaragdicoccus niigatensis]|uniref:HD domain-containing protein n=1 Tax=Smaragdicoccus niigatensis TaxID=359359 RepID=UPI00037D28CC|nr:HD domain-containing protein [Smaragdicoccus niigatensis]